MPTYRPQGITDIVTDVMAGVLSACDADDNAKAVEIQYWLARGRCSRSAVPIYEVLVLRRSIANVSEWYEGGVRERPVKSAFGLPLIPEAKGAQFRCR